MQRGYFRGVTLVTHSIAFPPSTQGKALDMIFPVTTVFSDSSTLV